MDVTPIPKHVITVGGDQNPSHIQPPRTVYELDLPEAEIKPNAASLLALSSVLGAAAYYMQETGFDVTTPTGDSVTAMIMRVGRTLQNMARNS